MDNNILAAVIGLGGALIGAVLAGWITYLSAKKQIEALKHATERQIEEDKNRSDELAKQNLSISKASYFMERFSSPSYMEIRDEVETFLARISTLRYDEKIHECNLICSRDNPERVRRFNRLHALGMFFGEIGVSFESGHLNVDGLAIFDRILPYYWNELSPFIRATHTLYGFPLNDLVSLTNQPLSLFNKFCYAYKEMLRNGLAKEPPNVAQK